MPQTAGGNPAPSSPQQSTGIVTPTQGHNTSHTTSATGLSPQQSTGTVAPTGNYNTTCTTNATAVSPQQSVDTITAIGIYNTTYITSPPVYSTASPDDSSSTIDCWSFVTEGTQRTFCGTPSVWCMPTICFDTPTLCGTGPFPTAHMTNLPGMPGFPTAATTTMSTTNLTTMTNVPRVPPEELTARLEQHQGAALDPPYRRLAPAQAQTDYGSPIKPTATGPTNFYSMNMANKQSQLMISLWKSHFQNAKL